MLYRLKRTLHSARFGFQTRRVLNTPPTPAFPNASCSMHSLVSRQDFPLYILAAKSLLRFQPKLDVNVYSDGTLRAAQCAILEAHIPGIKIISCEEADREAKRRLISYPRLRQARQYYSSWRRLVDSAIWCQTPFRITCDSDILTCSRPTELLQWLRSPTLTLLMGKGRRLEEGDLNDQGTKWDQFVQQRFKGQIPTIAHRLGWPGVFEDGVTGGFYGCATDVLSLQRIEEFLEACAQDDVRLDQWGSEQCAIIYLLSIQPCRRLNPETYLNFYPECVDALSKAHIVHFIGGNRFYAPEGFMAPSVYATLANNVIDEMQSC